MSCVNARNASSRTMAGVADEISSSTQKRKQQQQQQAIAMVSCKSNLIQLFVRFFACLWFAYLHVLVVPEAEPKFRKLLELNFSTA